MLSSFNPHRNQRHRVETVNEFLRGRSVVEVEFRHEDGVCGELLKHSGYFYAELGIDLDDDQFGIFVNPWAHRLKEPASESRLGVRITREGALVDVTRFTRNTGELLYLNTDDVDEELKETAEDLVDDMLVAMRKNGKVVPATREVIFECEEIRRPPSPNPNDIFE